MKEKLKTIKNFVQSIISPTIEQRINRWVGSMPSPRPTVTEIQSSQDIVNNAMSLIRQNARNAASAPIVVHLNGNSLTEKHSRLALHTNVQ